mmetsp:Transcript_21877/g.32549  ORF Transcript_21877/g.32549 Transcript_21877/m.32549 type:complete len:590 (-) Transcript_21877:272-2041(-)|eukprot:CAMPEP_0194047832 /NCGR_PEP_ID=MMETSP0009_2-20130614/25747_1 /TAXON_ID=210454 /ORGANISM="Grammatophora oceanica, Strain CCMP 410" /LENGTH=589 /DNA_ID=CAMNT_0038693555 /DNA_START=88 /DNA_END=1857 /DNA_ORIENTATION=+
MMFNFKSNNNNSASPASETGGGNRHKNNSGGAETSPSHQSHNNNNSDLHNDTEQQPQQQASPSSSNNSRKKMGGNNNNGNKNNNASTNNKNNNATSKRSKRSRRRRKGRKSAQIEPMTTTTTTTSATSTAPHDAPMTKSDLYFALDCEMVGIGPKGFDSAVARVTIVNWDRVVVLDTFVKIPVLVTDYRTHVSGIQPHHVCSEDAMTFAEVSKAVQNILRGKILIGHGLENDLCALGLTHPWCDVRDTARYAPYMMETIAASSPEHPNEQHSVVLRPRKLRDLAWTHLGRAIQMEGVPHSPVEDAIAALDLYKAARVEWEKELSRQQQEKIKMQEEQQQQAVSRNGGWFSLGGGGGANTTAAAASLTPQQQQQQQQVYPPPQQRDPRLLSIGPYGLGIPGYSPLPEEYVQEAKSQYPQQQQQQQVVQQQQQNSSTWFWRRPRSPSPQRKTVQMDAVLEDDNKEEEQQQQPEVALQGALESLTLDNTETKKSSSQEKSWRAYSLFFPRRPKSPSSSSQVISTPTLESSATMDTSVSDDLSTTASSLANTTTTTLGSIWSPDYSAKDEDEENDAWTTTSRMTYPEPQYAHI